MCAKRVKSRRGVSTGLSRSPSGARNERANLHSSSYHKPRSPGGDALMNARTLTLPALLSSLCVLAGVSLATLPAAAHAAESCPNEPVRLTQPHGLQLPDCRAYVQVSPPGVNLDAEGFPGSVESSLSGGRVRYWSVAPFGGVPGSCALAGSNADYISSRASGGGWSTEGILPCEASAGRKLGFSEDLSETFLWAEGDEALELATGAPLSGRSYYVRYTVLAGGERYRLITNVQI